MTSGIEIVLGWVAIGICASIAGWIWPFRRGIVGILVNAGVAIAGAIVVGLLGFMFHAYGRTLVTTSFLWAAVGAIGALVLAHLVWTRMVRAHPRGGH